MSLVVSLGQLEIRFRFVELRFRISHFLTLERHDLLSFLDPIAETDMNFGDSRRKSVTDDGFGARRSHYFSHGRKRGIESSIGSLHGLDIDRIPSSSFVSDTGSNRSRFARVD